MAYLPRSLTRFLAYFAIAAFGYLSVESVYAAARVDISPPIYRAEDAAAQQQQPATVRVDIVNAGYRADRDVYELALSIDHPQRISRLYLAIWDVRGGMNVSGDRIYERPDGAFVAEISTENLEPEREYTIRIRADDFRGILVQLPPKNPNDPPETILAELDFVYRPPIVEPAEFTIQTVATPEELPVIRINLNAPPPRAGEQFEGFFVVKETGQPVHEFGPLNFIGNRIEIERPESMRATYEEQEYVLTMYLLTPRRVRPEQGMVRSESATYEFTVAAIPRPTFTDKVRTWWTQTSTALAGQPIILIAILFITLNVTGWLLFKPSRGDKKKKGIRPPTPLPSIMFTPTDSMNVRLQITETPNRGDMRERLIDRFPCVIGRESGDVPIPGDQRISSRHAQITRKNNKLYLTDLNSRNGTFVNGGQIQPNKPFEIKGTTTVKLGPRTTIVLKIQG